MEGGDNRGRVNGGIPKGMNMSLDDLISARKTNNKQSTVGTTNTPRRQQLLPRRPRGAIQKVTGSLFDRDPSINCMQRGSHPWDTNTEEESHYRRLARPTAAAPTLRITTNVRGAPGSSSRIVQSAAPLTRLRISNIHHGVSREDLEVFIGRLY